MLKPRSPCMVLPRNPTRTTFENEMGQVGKPLPPALAVDRAGGHTAGSGTMESPTMGLLSEMGSPRTLFAHMTFTGATVGNAHPRASWVE